MSEHESLFQSRKARIRWGLLAAAVVGAILGVTNAPLWVGLVGVAVLCFTVLPWAMLADEGCGRCDRRGCCDKRSCPRRGE